LPQEKLGKIDGCIHISELPESTLTSIIRTTAYFPVLVKPDCWGHFWHDSRCSIGYFGIHQSRQNNTSAEAGPSGLESISSLYRVFLN
jgi:hypothetical protein